MSGYDDVATIWEMLTSANAAVFGEEAYGFEPGADGSLVVYDAATPFDVLRTRASRELVLHNG